MPDAELLARLKPPHWPEAAPIVASDDLLVAVALGLAAGLAVALLVAIARRRRSRSPGRAALSRIEAASARPAEERLAETAAALRDFMRAAAGVEAAAARGADWLAVLDRQFGTRFFSTGDGRLLADGLYAPVDERSAEAACAGAADLMRRRAA